MRSSGMLIIDEGRVLNESECGDAKLTRCSFSYAPVADEDEVDDDDDDGEEDDRLLSTSVAWP